MTPYKKRLNPFIQRMAEDMQLRNLADSTIDAYESVSNSWEAAVSPVHRASLAKPVLGPTFTSGPAGRPRNPTGPPPSPRGGDGVGMRATLAYANPC